MSEHIVPSQARRSHSLSVKNKYFWGFNMQIKGRENMVSTIAFTDFDNICPLWKFKQFIGF